MAHRGFPVGSIPAVLVFCSLALGETVERPGRLHAVTLYRGQALVTRHVALEGPAGAVQLVVTDLPEQVQGDSLYASAGENVQIRSVRYRTKAVREAPREEVRTLDEQIAALEAEIRKGEMAQRTNQKQAKHLEGVQTFVAPTARAELTKGVLNAETLMKVSEFIFEQSRKLNETAFTLSEAQLRRQKELDLLRTERARLTRAKANAERQAVVHLDQVPAGPVVVRLSYVVAGASWSPAYNLKAADERKAVRVEYDAVIQQTSGEDWEQVELTLSTASPRMVAEAPILTPLLVTLGPHSATARNRAQQKQALGGYHERLRGYEKQRQRSVDRTSQLEAQWLVNDASASGQIAELSVSPHDVNTVQQTLGRPASGLSVNYQLEGRATVASRRDQQIVRIADLSLPAAFCNVAVPLLTELVYRQAEITNDREVALLEGQANVYLDGDFVGRGTIPMVATGQKFAVGFGTDPQLRTWREFISRDESVQGGNRVVQYRYRLVMDNYKAEPAVVRAFDRIPYSPEQIRVALGEMTAPLSKDQEYVRAFRPHGILRWDVAVPSGSAAATAHILEYGFALEFDRDMDITTAARAAQEEQSKDYLRRRMLAK